MFRQYSILWSPGRMDLDFPPRRPFEPLNERLLCQSNAKQPRHSRNFLEDSPQLHKLPSQQSINRLLSINRRLQAQRITTKLHSTIFNFDTPKYKQDRFYDTTTNGFIMNERPVSKQQSRSRVGDTEFLKIKNLDEGMGHDGAEGNGDDFEGSIKWGEAGKAHCGKAHCGKEQRPETSKGERNKHAAGDKETSDHRNSRKEEDDSVTPKVKRVHPVSAMPKSRPSPLDDLIKINTRIPDKKDKKTNLPFSSVIDSEFLSLFANGEQA